jgi:hypothetical protein
MPRYAAFYDQQKVEVEAPTSFIAQDRARAEFARLFPRRKIKGHQIALVRADEPVDPASLPGA